MRNVYRIFLLTLLSACTGTANISSIPQAEVVDNLVVLEPQDMSIVRTAEIELHGVCSNSTVRVMVHPLSDDLTLGGSIASADCTSKQFTTSAIVPITEGLLKYTLIGYNANGAVASRGSAAVRWHHQQLTLDAPVAGTPIAGVKLANLVMAGNCSARGKSVEIIGTQVTTDPDSGDDVPSPNFVFGTATCDTKNYTWNVTVDASSLYYDGTPTVITLRELDANSAQSALITQTFSLDYSPPNPGHFLVNGSWSDRVGQALVSVRPLATDSDMYTLSNGPTCATLGAWTPMATATPVTLDFSSGSARVSAVFRDAAGNETGCITSQQIFLQPATAPLQVASRYPGYANWQATVGPSANSVRLSYFSSCYSSACLNIGILRKVFLPNLSSCANVSASDDLAVFNWTCIDDLSATEGGVIVSSTGFAPGKGVRNLVTEAGWRNNRVTVHIGANVYHTDSEAWWRDAVIPLPNNSTSAAVDLNQANALYVLGTTRTSNGYRIRANDVGLVTLPGVQLIANASMPNNCANAAADTLADQRRCLLSTHQPYSGFYFEGDLVGYPGDGALVGNLNASRLTLRNFSMDGRGIEWGLHQDWGSQMTMRDGRITNVGSNNCTICNNSFFYNLNVSNIISADGNNGHGQALGGYHTGYSIYSNIVIANAALGGILERGYVASNVYHQLTIANVGNAGLLTQGLDGYYPTFNQIFVANAQTGLIIDNQNPQISQLAISDSDTGLLMGNRAGLKAYNNLLLGNNGTQCNISGPGSQLTTNSCAANAGSANVSVSGSSFFTSLNGRVVANDNANSADTDGKASQSTLSDWMSFDNFYRSWGVESATTPPLTTYRAACTTGDCRIWDFRLSPGDTVLRNRSGDFANANEPFVAGSACPAAVNGNRTLTHNYTYTFLVNAQEIMNDGIGNDNGLCESGEACIYSPNVGAYQGSGDYLAAGTCTFTDGPVVKNVKMYGYPNN